MTLSQEQTKAIVRLRFDNRSEADYQDVVQMNPIRNPEGPHHGVTETRSGEEEAHGDSAYPPCRYHGLTNSPNGLGVGGRRSLGQRGWIPAQCSPKEEDVGGVRIRLTSRRRNPTTSSPFFSPCLCASSEAGGEIRNGQRYGGQQTDGEGRSKLAPLIMMFCASPGTIPKAL